MSGEPLAEPFVCVLIVAGGEDGRCACRIGSADVAERVEEVAMTRSWCNEKLRTTLLVSTYHVS